MKTVSKARTGPAPKPESINAALRVINDGWTMYRAAKCYRVTQPTVARQVRRLRKQAAP